MPEPGRPARGPLVLVVDDERDHALTVRAILARDDLEVSLAADADEALQLARVHDFRLAIIDLRLPGRDGLATMHALWRERPGLRCLILTAYPSPGTLRTALSEGASAYLEKPCSPEGLRAIVASLLALDEA